MASWRGHGHGHGYRHGASLKLCHGPKPSARAPSDAATVLGRLPRQEDADSGERRLNLTMTGTQFFALERLVAHFGLSRRAVIERMIDWADDTFSRSLYDDEAAFKTSTVTVTKNNPLLTGSARARSRPCRIGSASGAMTGDVPERMM